MDFDILKMNYMVEFTEEDRERALSLFGSRMSAVFIYSPSVLRKSGVDTFDPLGKYKTVTLGTKVMVPTMFFAKFYGAKVNFSFKKVDIFLDDKTYSVAPYMCECASYVDVLEASLALGLSAVPLYDGRLVVVEGGEGAKEFIENDRLAEALAYELFGKFDSSVYTAEDYRASREKWKERLVGSPQINDLSDTAIAEKVEATSSYCEKNLSLLNLPDENGTDPVILFGELHVPTESEELTEQYRRLYSLATGYGTFGSRYYKDSDLLDKILYGLRWMYDHMYGEAEIEERGWRSAHAFNWWHWFCGASDALTDILLIVYDFVDKETISKYLRCFKWVTTFMRTEPNRASASSRLKPCTKMALLLEDTEWLSECHVYLDMLMGVEEYGEGIHKDFCQWTHAFPHNIAYGLVNLHRALFVSSVMSSTPINLSGPKKYNQFLMLKYTFEPAVYNGEAFLMFSGRGTENKMMYGASSLVEGLLPMLGVYGEDEDKYIRSFIKRQLSSDDIITRAKSGCSIYDAKLLSDIINDDTIDPNYDYEYAHAWFTGDRAAQHRCGYAVGIALSSERECTYECINGQNKRGWHTGDGATFLYTGYDPEAYDGDNFFTKNINIAYRIPGTTEDMREKEERSILGGEAWHNPTAFAGSMQIEDKYILAAMEFIAMHFEGPDKEIVDTGYGTGLAVHFNDLKAKKAWFCFDRETVMLGAKISSTMNSEVRTTVEHRRIVSDSDVQYLTFLDGKCEKIDTAPTEIRKDGLSTVLMPSHAGYVFPGGANAYVSRYVSEEAGGQVFFELGVNHGVNPKNEEYVYAILPHATEEELDSYAKDVPFEVISNTESVQAVKKDSLNIECYVFYEAASCGIVTAGAPMLVTLISREEGTVIKVCDPTHKLSEARLIIDKKFTEASYSPRLKALFTEKTEITVDFSGAHGRTFDIILK